MSKVILTDEQLAEGLPVLKTAIKSRDNMNENIGTSSTNSDKRKIMTVIVIYF
jgi:hypothetical protein